MDTEPNEVRPLAKWTDGALDCSPAAIECARFMARISGGEIEGARCLGALNGAGVWEVDELPAGLE